MSAEPDVRHPLLVRLLLCWRSARAGRPFPTLEGFGAQDLADFDTRLAMIAVEPATAGGSPRFRYLSIGDDLLRLLPEDFTGRCIDEVPNRLYRYVAGRAYRAVLAARGPQAGRFLFFRDRWFGRYERLLLPLSEDGATIDLIVGGFLPEFRAAADDFGEGGFQAIERD